MLDCSGSERYLLLFEHTYKNKVNPDNCRRLVQIIWMSDASLGGLYHPCRIHLLKVCVEEEYWFESQYGLYYNRRSDEEWRGSVVAFLKNAFFKERYRLLVFLYLMLENRIIKWTNSSYLGMFLAFHSRQSNLSWVSWMISLAVNITDGYHTVSEKESLGIGPNGFVGTIFCCLL